MSNIPPSFSFKGDRQKSISLRAQARQFYNFIVNQAELGGIPFINRSLVLSDGSIISIVSKKESIYGHRTGTIFINTVPTIKEVLNEEVLYITLMEPDGTVGYYTNPAQPPYQPYKERRYYSKGQFKLRNDKYAGGQLQRIDTGQFVGTGGSWHNYKDTVVSWTHRIETPTKYSFYIADTLIEVPVITGYSVEKACLAPVALSDLAELAGATHTLVVLFRHVNELKLKLYAVNIITEYAKAVPSTLSVISYPTPIYVYDMVSGFSTDGYKFAMLATNITTARQKITLVEFSSDYSSFTATDIYDKVARSIVSSSTTTTNDVAYSDWTSEVNSEFSLIPGGEDYISSISMEKVGVALLLYRAVSYISSAIYFYDSIGESIGQDGGATISVSDSRSNSNYMAFCSFSGVISAVVAIGPPATYTYSNDESLTYVVGTGYYGSSVVSTVSTGVRVIHFSYEYKTAIYVLTESDTYSTRSYEDGVGPDSSVVASSLKLIYEKNGSPIATFEIDSKNTSTSGTSTNAGSGIVDTISSVTGLGDSSSSSENIVSSLPPSRMNSAHVSGEWIGCLSMESYVASPTINHITLYTHGSSAQMLTYRIDNPDISATATYYSPITIAR